MAMLVSIIAELYTFVGKISLHENNYALKQRLSFTEKEQWDCEGKKNWFLSKMEGRTRMTS